MYTISFDVKEYMEGPSKDELLKIANDFRRLIERKYDYDISYLEVNVNSDTDV